MNTLSDYLNIGSFTLHFILAGCTEALSKLQDTFPIEIFKNVKMFWKPNFYKFSYPFYPNITPIGNFHLGIHESALVTLFHIEYFNWESIL